MMRGGHLDFCVLGAFQVSVTGDLANWHTGAPDAIPAVGGAMDLAIGAKKVYVMMEHLTKSGQSKVVRSARIRSPGVGCVNRIFTDLAVIDVTPQGLKVVEMAEGLTWTSCNASRELPYMAEAFICDAIRTPIGRYAGALSSVRTDDLAGDSARSPHGAQQGRRLGGHRGRALRLREPGGRG
jgi:hypothetical protein